jgi:hypothetical protein
VISFLVWTLVGLAAGLACMIWSAGRAQKARRAAWEADHPGLSWEQWKEQVLGR